MNIQHYTYRVTWSPEDNEHVALCAEFPSLSWLAKTPESALRGIQKVVADVVADMLASGEAVPDAFRKELQRRVSRAHPADGSPSTGVDGGGARGQSESVGECEAGGLKQREFPPDPTLFRC